MGQLFADAFMCFWAADRKASAMKVKQNRQFGLGVDWLGRPQLSPQLCAITHRDVQGFIPCHGWHRRFQYARPQGIRFFSLLRSQGGDRWTPRFGNGLQDFLGARRELRIRVTWVTHGDENLAEGFYSVPCLKFSTSPTSRSTSACSAP